MSPVETMLFPVEQRDVIEVASPDAARFLHNYCTCDVKNLADGDFSEAFFPTDKGRILAYGLVESVGKVFYVSGSAGTADSLVPHLSKYAFLDGVTVTNVSSEWAQFVIVGDDANALCEQVLGGSAARFFETLEASQPCVRVVVPSADVEAVRNGFLSVGVVEGSDTEREFVRITAGVPIAGTDVSEQNLVQEAARTRIAVSFTKGCYLGQEPIARLDAMGHTNKELRTIEFAEPVVVSVGDEVSHAEKMIGHMTSVATAYGMTAALAVLRKAGCDVGAVVTVGEAEGRVAHAEAAMAAAGRIA